MFELIDFHNHCLPIDDGAKNDIEFLDMIHDAMSSSIKKAYATPHIIPNGKFDLSLNDIYKSYNYAKELLIKNNIKFDLRIGCEFQINKYALEYIDNNKVIFFEDTNYLLVEFSRQNIDFSEIDFYLEEISRKGIRILIAHPERYFDNVEVALIQVNKWILNGYFLQLNRSSLFNSQKSIQRKIAYSLLNRNMIHIISSDAHEPKGKRRLILNDCYSIIVEIYGKSIANHLFFINPKNLINNKDLKIVESI